MRTPHINPDDIILTTIKLIAKDGLNNFSTKKAASACGISEGSLFHYFPTKKELLNQALAFIDKALDEAFQAMSKGHEDMNQLNYNLWYTYFNHLRTNIDYTKFYQALRHSSFYTPEVEAGRRFSFSHALAMVHVEKPYLSSILPIFWIYLSETTINFAISIADGNIPDTPENIQAFYNLLLHGATSTLNDISQAIAPEE